MPFSYQKKYLQYGVVEKTNPKTLETECIPAILIQKTYLFINICEDRLRSRMSNMQYHYKVFPAEFLEDDKHYCFHYEHGEEKINKPLAREFYLYKVFSQYCDKLVGVTQEDLQ